MAAELVLTFAAEGILTKVSLLAANKIALARGFHTELEKLRQSLSNIQDFLGSAADQRLDDRGKAVETWVKKLQQVAEDADDVLDEFEYELLRQQVELRNHMKRKVLNFLSASNPLWFRFKMAHKIKKINDSLVELKNEAPLINLVAKKGDSRQRPDRVQTDSFFEKGEKVVGREDAVTKIVTTLISSDIQQKDLSVMAIVGMAGLGKTTLAKSVYNESAIKTHFHQRIWVCVSNTFEVDTILSLMVESLTKKAGMKSRDALLQVLREEITGKRYVLVLDDVWNEEREKWDSLMSCLSKLNSNPGSCIIVTTRSAYVSTIAETLPRPELRKLSEEECWSIIKQRALNLDENGFIDAELERIGRAIAEKCGGVPLVAKVLGSLLGSRASKVEWLSIRDNRLWELPEGEDRIMKVLKLSFDNLEPSPLKQCFAYCSMLRKDFEIERDNLIQLWMAQGLLQTSSTVENHHEMEDTGKEYFNILLNNSLFQEVIEGGTITKYTMHDLVHDLAEKVSKSERLTQELNDDVRHVARSRPPSTLENMSKVTVGRLRSLFSNDQVPENIFSKFKAMRVLSLDTSNIEELPNSFGKLKHLRYLDLSKTRIKALPKAIGKLYNLQTLRMQYCDLNKLPREMQNLINLRHLCVDEYIEFPAGMFRGLTNLRTLSCFNVGEEMGCRIEELRGLNQLKGMLTIRNLENVRDEAEAKKAKLEEKKNVVELSLDFSWRPLTSNIHDENVLEGLQPHTELEILRITFFMGDRFPSWMMRVPLPLNNLKKLVLTGCLKCGELSIGHLPFLRDVEINGMDNLKRFGSEIYGYDLVYDATREKETIVLFPALKTLKIFDCRGLIEWMEAPTTTTTKVEVFPCLEELTIVNCPSIGFIRIPYSTVSLRELRIQSCHALSSIGQLDHCTSLQELRIGSCNALSSIGLTSSQGLPSLRKLIITFCGGLSTLPSGIENCTSLELLHVFGCKNLATISFTRVLPSLRKLGVLYCDNLSCLAVREYRPSFQELNPCLEKLTISFCKGLQSLPDFRSFTSLRDLRLGPFWENLDSFPDFQVQSQQLVSLELNGWPKLKSLPQQVQHLTSLTRLAIWFFKGVETLPEWLGNLASLVELRIQDCEILKYLPSLEAMQRLTKLQRLEVIDCPLLEERCTEDSGEEWPKISHIQNIRI
ncbi:PREDICTED: putative disease resistance protein RGA3-like [Fragaria vesca subsp. vesca]|uniref:putative disease resistance protein RGA3 n=1 Tax=Fragaria vesca subsp. vesca TaxID=101020 RepID=UPI0002C2FB25|nr:PREDICTED: putative disease resistance protein RGA3 [Fragaria vesca subsp. vesca]XP_011467979.1 PREDICTED: putative disease resistance protein RGA3 [Fragaria vesca subsp. vesca]XP_011467980.1 PREDICTED: putative disease resistance protein RGA3 [Fragaria vesca subsp. vesca]XP_011467981.1 PREDICTED: putative disease resistance protein RGA3 [Fragaria vesca subsp. vesca]XP_011467982.1 PREDICTED: putative disease resistance protein RGA3 [Fragaria vesca subsp. vesca]XP_011467983.1 PREDICTED: puta